MALVIESSELSGGYILGFRLISFMVKIMKRTSIHLNSLCRIDPQEKLQEIQKEISALHKLYSSVPVFGVEYTTQEEPLREEDVIPVDTMDDYNEIDESNPETQDAFAAYLAESTQKDREVGSSSAPCKYTGLLLFLRSFSAGSWESP